MFAAIQSKTTTYSDGTVATVATYAPGQTTVLFNAMCYAVLSPAGQAITGWAPMLPYGGGYYRFVKA